MRYILRHIKLIVCCIIILGFACVTLESHRAYKQVFDHNIRSISELGSLTIYHEIDKALSMPVAVSLSMANDSFLQAWLEEEQKRPGNAGHIRQLQNYLAGLQKKFKYNSVFVVSEASRTYFHYEGKSGKTISPRNARDAWYYGFVNSGRLYGLDVDTDEADHNALTVFVNCRIDDDNGKLLGVLGVGMKMHRLQDILTSYERRFALKAYLVNDEGVIQVASDSALIEKRNLFATPPLSELKDKLLGHKDETEGRWSGLGSRNICMLSRYVDTLGWYLIVEKDTSPLRSAFRVQLIQSAATALLVIAAVLLPISYLMNRHSRTLEKLAVTDKLTSLPNRGALGDIISREVEATRDWKRTCHAFLFDVDFFKQINDRHGHLAGDRVLVLAARLARESAGESGMVARWGGDEFFGLIHADAEESRALLERLLAAVREHPELRELGVSLSIGVTRVEETDDMDSLVSRADEALYHSKNDGRDRLSFI